MSLITNLSIVHTQSLETQFTRQINRYVWQAKANYKKLEGKWQGSFYNHFKAEALILNANLFTFRDENVQNFQLQRNFNPQTAFKLYGKQYLFRQNQTFTQDILAGFRYQLLNSAFVEPLLGFALDQRQGAKLNDGIIPLNRDFGLATGFQGGIQKDFGNGYLAQLSTQNLWQFIRPRQGVSILVMGNVARNLNEKGQYQLEGKRAKLQRESYQALSLLNRENTQESIESVQADTLTLNFTLQNQLNKYWSIQSKIGLENHVRKVRTKLAPLDALFFDTDLNRIAVDADIAVVFQNPKLQFLSGFRRGADNERRKLVNGASLPPTQAAIKGDLLRRTDFDRTHLGMYGDFKYAFSDATTLSSEFSGSILRHDTPDANPDDRDEVFYQGALKIQSRFSPYLVAETSLWGQFNHLVYLKAERSAENNIQRILRLKPALIWQPSPKTDIRLQPEIRVTYTVADFELPGRANTDQSARELRYQLAVKQDLPQNSTLLFKAETGDLRLGRLIWARFAEIPFDTIQTLNGKLGLETANNTGKIPYKVEVGVQAFLRSDAERAITLRYPFEGTNLSLIRAGKNYIRQIGPTTKIQLNLQKNSEISLEGWLAFQRVYQQLYGVLPENQAQIIQETAKKGTFRLIPDVQLRTVWRF